MSAAPQLPLHNNMPNNIPNNMPFALRTMQEHDIHQAAEIERDAFPTLFPPTAFRRELNNRIAKYIVAQRIEPPQQDPSATTPPRIGSLLQRTARIWRKRPSPWQPGQPYLVGVLGAWYMVDEAHIISIGVRSSFRGRGIGELLLIGALEQAITLRMRAATLEVRVSNHIAQNLYKKYGFQNAGIRKAYYSDNREDALIMTAHSIRSLAYASKFTALTESHQQRWGISDRNLS